MKVRFFCDAHLEPVPRVLLSAQQLLECACLCDALIQTRYDSDRPPPRDLLQCGQDLLDASEGDESDLEVNFPSAAKNVGQSGLQAVGADVLNDFESTDSGWHLGGDEMG